MKEEEMKVLHNLQVTTEGNVILGFLSSILEGKSGVLDLLHVEEVLTEITDQARRELAEEQRESGRVASSENMKEKAEDLLEKLIPNFTLNAFCTSGDPAKEVTGQLSRKEYDLLSLEAYGRGVFRKSVLGAHVNEIVQESPIPTLVHKGEADSCERVLVHVPNDKERCRRLVSYLADLLAGPEPAVTFLVILTEESEKFEGYTSGEEDYLLESIENYEREEFQYLEIAEEIMADRGVETEARRRVGEVSGEILAEAKEGRYDLMVFSPQKPNVLTSFWAGDESLKVMRDIDISILRVPPTTFD